MTLIEALRVLLPELDGGPFIYRVRDSARESGDGWEGSSWDHPHVKEIALAIGVVKVFLNEDGK